MDDLDFKNRYGPWALIAGASEGTGASFARQLAAKGINLILIARREGPLTALADDIRASSGVECVTASIDLSLDDATQQMQSAAGDREVGLVIMNAGADGNGSSFLGTDLANWDSLVMRNVVTTMRAVYAFAGPMKERGRGGLMLVGSGVCYGGLPGISVYGATKAFDLVLGEGLWAELRPSGVDVLNLILGRTDTPAHRELMEAQGIPIPEGMADADDVARLGLERLPFGPVCNWGEADDEAKMFASSAAQRRDRIIHIMSRSGGHVKAD